jgi:hypothetical protein
MTPTTHFDDDELLTAIKARGRSAARRALRYRASGRHFMADDKYCRMAKQLLDMYAVARGYGAGRPADEHWLRGMLRQPWNDPTN